MKLSPSARRLTTRVLPRDLFRFPVALIIYPNGPGLRFEFELFLALSIPELIIANRRSLTAGFFNTSNLIFDVDEFGMY